MARTRFLFTAIIEKDAAKHNLTSTKEPQIFLWESFDTVRLFIGIVKESWPSGWRERQLTG